MKRLLVPLAALILARSAGAQSQQGGAPARPDPPMRPHYAKGIHIPGMGGNPDLSWHGGPVLTGTSVKAIFWGTSWATDTSDKIGGLDSFYEGVGGGSYAKTSDEYSGSNGKVTSAISFLGHIVDPSQAPSGAPSTSQVLAEVCKVITAPSANGYYSVYVDTPRGSAGYCAWHSWGSCNGVPVEFSFFFKLDGDTGCDPGDTSGLHSQGLAALANVSGHELSEARTDPAGAGWIDKQGQENGDLCAWTYGTPLLTFPNNSQWKIQGNWSNTAYGGRFGYPNFFGQKGCLDGGNYPAVAP